MPRQSFLPLASSEGTLSSQWRPEAPPSLDGVNAVDLDCETTGLHRFRDRPVGLALGAKGRTWYLPWGHKGGGPQLDEAIVKRWALTELRGKRIRNLNTKFDVHLMESWGVPLREMGCTFHDVAYSEALLDDLETAFTLEHLSQKRLKEGKEILPLPGAAIADLPASTVAAYAQRDVALVARLAEVYAPLLASEDLGRVSDLEDEVLPVAIELERNGLPLDMERLVRWEQESKALLERLNWELYRSVGFTVNTNSPKDMTRLFHTCGAPLTRTVTGTPSFTAPIVRAASHHAPIDLAYRIGKIEDLRSKSLVKYLTDQEDGVLYPHFHQLKYDRTGGTVSGRWSSSRPNAQNVTGAGRYKRDYSWLAEYTEEPWVVRRLFVPGHGRWVSADQRAVEFRWASHYANARPLIETFRRNPLADFHEVVTEMIRPIRPDITRDEAKTSSFLKLYGGGPSRLAEQLGITDGEGRLLSDQYDEAFPEFRAFLQRAAETAKTRGYVRTVLGRRARFPGQQRLYSAANRICQGSAADDAKIALVEVYKQRKSLGLTLRCIVHDEIGGDLQSDDVAPLLSVLDEQRTGCRVPILWSAKTGDNWDAAK